MVKLNNQFFEIILQGYRSPVNREGLKIGNMGNPFPQGFVGSNPTSCTKPRLKLKKIIEKMIKQELLLFSSQSDWKFVDEYLQGLL